MANDITKLRKSAFPPLLIQIPDPPDSLHLLGTFPSFEQTFLCVVGSRKYTNYGKEVCEKIISGLSGYPIVIVSGLAIGIDSIAHRSALSAGLKTIAIPGSGLNENVLYPSSNRNLAKSILKSGGVLLSPFESDFKATQWSFPARNRIMAGISHAVLIIEAEEKSGTLITARLALDYNRDVYAVPGSIFSPTSKGTNSLIASGATPVTSSEDLINGLGYKIQNEIQQDKRVPNNLSQIDLLLLELLHEPKTREEITIALNIPISKINEIISFLEINSLVVESGNKIRRM